ncbi:MAG: hypothetical protein JXA30_05985 [Deltaproteobacteria bacterium]|nr:hypothetical protein [Deltaproteobacteria bacterium]
MTDQANEGEEKAEVRIDEQPRLDSGLNSLERERLAQAARSFEAGDYQNVRRLADQLINSSDPQIVRAARDLKRGVGVDPVQTAVIIFCSALFLAIAITYILR